MKFFWVSERRLKKLKPPFSLDKPMWSHFHRVYFAVFSLNLGKITETGWVKQWKHNNIYINSGLVHTKYLVFSLVRDYHQISNIKQIR